MSRFNTSDSTLLIFLHIPKTAGRTLESVLDRNFSQSSQFDLNSWTSVWDRADELKSLPDSDKKAIRLIRGHYPFGIHSYLPGEVKYFSFLRSPVERVASLYEYIKRNQDHHLYYLVSEKGFTIKDFLQSDISDEFRNSQVRMISGHSNRNQNIRSSKTDLLNQALDNIEKYFIFTGTVETFDISLLILAQKINLHYVFYETKNAAPRKITLSDETIEEIKSYNELDLKLWSTISDRILEEYQSIEPLLLKKLSRLKFYNSVYSNLKQMGRKIKYLVHS
jgi:hypothetical protein